MGWPKVALPLSEKPLRTGLLGTSVSRKKGLRTILSFVLGPLMIIIFNRMVVTFEIAEVFLIVVGIQDAK